MIRIIRIKNPLTKHKRDSEELYYKPEFSLKDYLEETNFIFNPHIHKLIHNDKVMFFSGIEDLKILEDIEVHNRDTIIIMDGLF